jgi:hypothetical protein
MVEEAVVEQRLTLLPLSSTLLDVDITGKSTWQIWVDWVDIEQIYLSWRDF